MPVTFQEFKSGPISAMSSLSSSKPDITAPQSFANPDEIKNKKVAF